MKKKYIILSFIVLFFIAVTIYTTQLYSPTQKPIKVTVIEKQEEILDDYPTIIVPPEATVSATSKKDIGSVTGYEGLWTTNEDVLTTTEWFLRELPNDSWEIIQEPDLRDNIEQFIIARKNQHDAYITIEKEDDLTEISIEFPVK